MSRLNRSVRSAPEIRVGGQQAEVLVETRGRRVVVAGADVGVPPDAAVPSRRTTRHVFACVFSPTTPYTTCTPGGLERPRERDVRQLVESSLQLDERHDLLAGLRGADERMDDRAVRRGAVQGLLDREHVGIARRLLHERLDRGRERVVGVMHEDVAPPDRREHVGRPLGRLQRRRGDRRPRIVLQIGPVEPSEEPQVAERRGATPPRRPASRRRPSSRIRSWRISSLIVGVDLEADRRRAALPPLQHGLDRGEQVVGLVFLDLDVGVAGHAEHVHARRCPCPGRAGPGAPRRPPRVARSARRRAGR